MFNNSPCATDSIVGNNYRNFIVVSTQGINMFILKGMASSATKTYEYSCVFPLTASGLGTAKRLL